nr:hypothetical protein [Tanacetum cinerariifolium]
MEQEADAKKSKGKEPAYVEASTTATANKIKGKEPAVQPSTPADAKKPRGMPKKATTKPSYGRIYYKNRGRSERIENQNKPFKFDKQHEENDKAWEAYANEFSEADFNQDFKEQIGVALTAADSLVPAAIPTQHSQVKSKGKEHFTPADVKIPTTAAAKKKRGRPKK